MQLFMSPPETRYDLHFSLAGIPVRVHPVFWVIALLFGYGSGNLVMILIWVAAMFISILLHELGHAFMMRAFGQAPRVLLYAGGGVTSADPVWWGSNRMDVALRANQEILVSLAGPLTGFGFAVLILALSPLLGGSVGFSLIYGFIPFPAVSFQSGLLTLATSVFLWINIFWGLINLLPVQPLDGGHVVRELLIKSDPYAGSRKALRVSTIAGGVMALVGLLLFRSVYVALMFGMLALQSYQTLRGGFGAW